MKVFISYSHNDGVALKRLHIHLAGLNREGSIHEWFDREILAGGNINAEVNEQLESSGLFLLLISPDFLASDYCMEREMERALERHRTGDARVVPIIIEPCDWESTPLRNLKALPHDGKPVSDWTNENNAYLNVVQELRRVLEEEEAPDTAAQKEARNTLDTSRSGVRRYRVKRDFDEIDRSEFREAAFGVIRDYFKSAVEEIDAIEDLKRTLCFTFGYFFLLHNRQQSTSERYGLHYDSWWQGEYEFWRHLLFIHGERPTRYSEWHVFDRSR